MVEKIKNWLCFVVFISVMCFGVSLPFVFPDKPPVSKVVTGKAREGWSNSRYSLIAEDGSECSVSAGVWFNTEVGDEHSARWHWMP